MRQRGSGKGRLAEDIAPDRRAVAPDIALPRRPRTENIARQEFVAIARLMIATGCASAATVEAEQHMIARSDPLERRADRPDHHRPFITQDSPKRDRHPAV